jgi:hypothetical protein
MIEKRPFLITVPLGTGIGFLVGLTLASSDRISPKVSNALGAPAFWAFEHWHQLGLPPQGEAALAGPYFAFIIQWTIVGAAIGAIWSCRRRTA